MRLGTEHLVDCTIYVMAHPCPMCLGSLYYCSPREVVFLATRDSYEQYYLDDRKYFEVSTFYDEFAKSWDRRRLPMRYGPARRRGGRLPVLERAQRRATPLDRPTTGLTAIPGGRIERSLVSAYACR